MHKPVRIIKDDARVRLTQQVNLTSAVRTALLTLPADFSERELFERIAGFSYGGDVRMLLPAENRGKVGNIVRKQGEQFKELYHRLVIALPGVHWPAHTTDIQQDTSPHARAAHLRKLPSNLLQHVTGHYSRQSSIPPKEADETVYWTKLAGDANLPSVIERGRAMTFAQRIEADLRDIYRAAQHCAAPFDHPVTEGRRQCRTDKERTVRRREGEQVVEGFELAVMTPLRWCRVTIVMVVHRVDFSACAGRGGLHLDHARHYSSRPSGN